MVLSGLISYLDFRVLWFHVDKSQWQIFALGNRGSWRGKDGWDPMAWPSGTILACGATIKICVMGSYTLGYGKKCGPL